MTQAKRHSVRGEVIWPAAHLDLTLPAYQREQFEGLENYRFEMEDLAKTRKFY